MATRALVLSSDYRFGDGDLGPRGMALFFKTFRHTTVADAMGIPGFPLSKNELKHQAKYEDDVYSLSADDSSKEMMRQLDRFARLDLNRNRRQSVLLAPPQLIVPEELKDTEKRSNKIQSREQVRKSLRASFRLPSKPNLGRSSSDVDEVKQCMELAKTDFNFDHKVFHRKASGEMVAKISCQNTRRASLLIRNVSEPMIPTTETRANLGKVHYQLAVLHGMNRFPEVVPTELDDKLHHDAPPHDAFSVLFHLSHAASLSNVPACLALGRVHSGLETMVSPLLGGISPIDFDVAKDLLRRAMESPHPPSAPKAAAGCLLYQILLDEGDTAPATMMTLLGDTIKLLEESQSEQEDLQRHKKRQKSGRKYQVGDRVQGNYALEGSYYPGVVEEVSEDGNAVVVKYDDDGTTESLTPDHVKLIVPPTATQTNLGGPLSDEEALGMENTDEKSLMEAYQLKAELAEFKENSGDMAAAAALYEEAAGGAMTDGKMKTATQWSLKACELQP
jgi:elongation factor 2 kinase